MHLFQQLTEKHHQRFKQEFGSHFKGSESELELAGGFIEDVIKDTAHNINKLNMPDEKTPKRQRTLNQNKALHLFFDWVATALNDAGLDMKAVLKPEVDIPWDQRSVKTHLWKPIQKAQLGKESTTELESGEIDQVFETFTRHLAKHGVTVEFPSAERRSEFFAAMDMAERLDYPVYEEPTI